LKDQQDYLFRDITHKKTYISEIFVF